MLVDEIGEVVITNDGATILQNMEVQSPAAKILIELAGLQDKEVGDGTTSVVIIASELLRNGVDLIHQGIHPTSVISGFRLAMRESCKYIESNLAVSVDELDENCLKNCARTSMNSKFLNTDSAFFSQMAVDAILATKSVDSLTNKAKYSNKSINIIKIHGQSALDSSILPGYAIHMGRATQSMPEIINNAKIACLDFELRKVKMQLGVQILITDPNELERIRMREADIIKERIEKILLAGANVVLTTKGIDDMALKYFVNAGALACRRVSRTDIKRIAKLTGAILVPTMADVNGNESFDAQMLGKAQSVYEEQIANDEIIVFRGCEESNAVSLLLRGSDHYMIEEIDRSLHDAMCVVKRVLESGTIVPGGGAVEAALPIFLETIALSSGSREQLAIAEFADALLQIPKILAVNATKDATELVAKLHSHYYMTMMCESKKNCHMLSYGLDLTNGVICDNISAGVIEPTISKIKMIKFATEAAVTIIRIDDFIKPEV